MTWMLPPLAFLVMAGASLDALMLRRQKAALYYRLVAWWCRVASAGPAQWHQGAVQAAQTALGFRNGRMQAWPLVVRVVLVSVVATTIARVVDMAIRGDGSIHWYVLNPLSFFSYFMWYVYSVNLCFDFASFFLGVGALVLLSQARGWWSILLVLGQAFVALMLSSLCLGFLVWTGVHHRGDPATQFMEAPLIASDRQDVRRMLSNPYFTSHLSKSWASEMSWSEDLHFRHDTQLALGESLANSPAAVLTYLQTGRASLPTLKYVEIQDRSVDPGSVVFRGKMRMRHSLWHGVMFLAFTNTLPWLCFAIAYVVLFLASVIQLVTRRPTAWLLEVLAGDGPHKRGARQFAPFTKLAILLGLLLGLLQLAASLYSP